jgi:hypothetical protein
LISLLSAGRTPWTRTGRRENERHRRPPLAPLTPHLPDRATLALVTLFDTLYAFFQEHQYCGEIRWRRRGRPRLDDVYVRSRDHPASGRCLTNVADS